MNDQTMNPRAISDSIKKATVAVIQWRANPTQEHPFKIIGSGFCVHPGGIVLTANHVFQSFKDQHHKSVLERVGEGVMAGAGRLSAETILAKHDERYMPREVVEALKKQGRWQEGSAKP